VNVLVIDIGGNNVKILATGQNESRKFPSGATMTPKQMVAGVKKLAGNWKYVTWCRLVTLGWLSGIGCLRNRITSAADGWGLTLKPRLNVPSRL
jgi:hypothetical protein